jgi:hypothetical protein
MQAPTSTPRPGPTNRTLPAKQGIKNKKMSVIGVDMDRHMLQLPLHSHILISSHVQYRFTHLLDQHVAFTCLLHTGLNSVSCALCDERSQMRNGPNACTLSFLNWLDVGDEVDFLPPKSERVLIFQLGPPPAMIAITSPM